LFYLKKIQESRINEYSRRITELNSYKDKIEDYEGMQDRLKVAEKELIHFKEKVRELAINLEELNILRETNRKQLNQIHQMTIDMENVDKLNKEYYAEMKRLQRIEKDNNSIRLQVNIFNC
jgi:chromosome segregation ATPase